MRHFLGYEVEVPGFWDLEKDPAPYADASFDGVVLMEVLEHFKVDPMFAMAELNRILRPGGFLFLTTPNIASWVSLYNMINWHTPYIYGMFERQPQPRPPQPANTPCSSASGWPRPPGSASMPRSPQRLPRPRRRRPDPRHQPL